MSSTIGTTHTWTATITFINLEGKDQSAIEGKIMSANLIIKEPSKIAETILSHNGGKSYIEQKSHALDEIADTNEGMYAMSDDYGISYYFRGAVDNNWVKFGKENGNDIWWRIVRINGNGSVKLIYSGTIAPTETEKVVMMGVKTQTATIAFNNKQPYKAEYIGYMYEVGVHRGHEENSTIKDYLDIWYEDNLLDYEKYLSDFIICIDRGFVIDNWVPVALLEEAKYSDVYKRLRSNTPQLICPHKEDRYTVKDTSIGNGKLTYPIGILTVEEATLAGGYRTTNNNSYYLYTNQDYRLLSPFSVVSSNVYGFDLNLSGHLNFQNVYFTSGVRPVISLSSNLSVSGSGYWNYPYIVDM